jgi:hypothetical protein
MSKILVLMGNENSHEGELSEIAKSRAELAIQILQEEHHLQVIPTGAFGDHFNTSIVPHGKILTNFLVENGIQPSKILPFTHSSNTLQDAYEVLRILSKKPDVEHVHVVSSDFHMERVKYIFGRVLQAYHLTFQEAISPVTRAELRRLLDHERKSLARLKKEWVDIAHFDLHEFPSEAYENLGNELRHYDNLSYIVVTGTIVLFGYFLSDNTLSGSSTLVKAVAYLCATFLVITLWYLYKRLADTAASARRVMIALERLYHRPGLSSTKISVKLLNKDIKVKDTVNIIMLIMLLFLILNSFQVLLY